MICPHCGRQNDCNIEPDFVYLVEGEARTGSKYYVVVRDKNYAYRWKNRGQKVFKVDTEKMKVSLLGAK